MGSARLTDFVVLIVLLVIAARVLPAAWRVTRIYSGIGSRRLTDGSAIAPPAPPAVAAVVERLAPLGFRRIGERTLVLPELGRRFEWNLVDEPTTTYVSLVPTGARAPGVLMVCYSAFADGAFVSTYWPSGTEIQRDDLLAGSGGPSPEDCVRTHAERMAAFAARHGLPLLNRSMGDLLTRDATYRSRHGGATMRRRVWAFDGLAALVVIAAVLTVARIIAEQ